MLLFGTTTLLAQDIQVVKLTVSPAGRPVPALNIRLTPKVRELVPGNAAALYYRAILELQAKLGDSEADRERRTARDGDWLELSADEMPLPVAKRALDTWHSPLTEVTVGAGRAQAVWDLPLREHGVATLLPEVQETRSLARLLALRARIAIVEHRFDDAAADLRTIFRMSQHVGESGSLISSLVGVACDGMALAQVEQWVGTADSPNLYWALTALPTPLVDTAIGLESEHLWFEADLPYLDLLTTSILSTEQAHELKQSLSRFLAMASDQPSFELPAGVRVPTSSEVAQFIPALAAYPTAKRELIERGRNAADVERMPVAQVVVLRWVEDYRDRLDEMIAWGQRPFPEALPALDELDKQLANTHDSPTSLFSRLLLPAVGAARRAGARTEQRVAALRVIEALRLYAASHAGRLPATLDEITEVPVPLDPVVGQPFIYDLRDSTATLRSSRPELVYIDIRYEITMRP